MTEDADLRRFGLERCQECHRIVLARALKAGVCQERTGCVLARQRQWLDEWERPVVEVVGGEEDGETGAG